MDVEFSNIDKLSTNGTGWFIGFSDWTKTGSTNLRHVPTDGELSNLCVKWMHHPVGDIRGQQKPISEDRTISILVSDVGGFRLSFSTKDNFNKPDVQNYYLQTRGDFVIWGPGLYHQAIVAKESTIMTVRWK